MHRASEPPVQIKERPLHPSRIAALTAQGIHPVLARVFASRDIDSAAQADTGLEGLLAPDALHNAHEAARWLFEAITRGEKLLVIADYDADGATACAVALRGLARFGARVEFLVPDRFAFGYGLTPALVEHALDLHRDDPFQRIITVDNGISSHAGVDRAKASGVHVLVTDHHLPGPTVPDCLIVNPNQNGCPFPSKHLAGVGVMFYVLLALRSHVRDIAQWPKERIPRMDDLLPIVALGTVADVVRLDANNRRLVAQGLQRLRKGSFPGLNALFQVATVDQRQANAGHLGFAIGPRLNAAGRLSDMSIGIRCLLEDDADTAMALADQLDALNRERREIESSAHEDAVEHAVGLMTGQRQPMGIVVHDAQWHQGVIGLIAGRLKERFYRPTIVFANDSTTGQLKGSCRSIPGVHIRDVLERIDTQHPGLIRAFGGHAMAAGLTLDADALGPFADIFDQTLRAFTDPTVLERVLETDGHLPEEYLRLDVAQLLTDQVWGQGFAPPVFVNEFRVLSQRRLKDLHLKLVLSPIAQPARIEAIWFNAATDLPASARLAYRLATNDWQGRTSLQLEVVSLA